MSINIIGTGSCVPKYCADNNFFTQLVDTSEEWITTRTGIKNRHILKDQTLTEISITAAINALENAGVKAEELDLIICSTMQGDYIVPSLACLIQQAIGANCPSFDINAACSGFIYALKIADGFITSSIYKKILVVSADKLSKFVDYKDRSTCVLFGDGAGAVVLIGGKDICYIKLEAKGGKENLNISAACPASPFCDQNIMQGYMQMNGREVFKFAVSAVIKAAKDAEKIAGIKADDIDFFLLHQANGRIIEMVQNQLNQPAEKFPVNYSEYGNTSAASIPILLDEQNRKGMFKSGDLLFLSAFGGGLTSGTCILKWH